MRTARKAISYAGVCDGLFAPPPDQADHAHAAKTQQTDNACRLGRCHRVDTRRVRYDAAVRQPTPAATDAIATGHRRGIGCVEIAILDQRASVKELIKDPDEGGLGIVEYEIESERRSRSARVIGD